MDARRAIHPLLCIGVFLAVSGCSAPEIEIAFARDGDAITATFSQDWGIIFSDIQAPCVDSVELYRSENDTQQTMWQIESAGTSCVDLDAVVIGTTPAGFTEVTALATELTGSYELLVLGVGSGGGSEHLTI